MVLFIGMAIRAVRGLAGGDKDRQPCSSQPAFYAAGPCACGGAQCAQCAGPAYIAAGPVYMTRREAKRERRAARRAARYGYPVVAAGPVVAVGPAYHHHRHEQQQFMPGPGGPMVERPRSALSGERRMSLDEYRDEAPPAYQRGESSSSSSSTAVRRTSVDVLMDEKRH